MNATYDYVIAGGGSAGCALAARLAEDTGVSVCLIEAGGSGRDLFIRMPAGNRELVTVPTHNQKVIIDTAGSQIVHHHIRPLFGQRPVIDAAANTV